MSARGSRVLLHAAASATLLSAALLFALPSAQAQKHGRGFPEIPNLNPGLSHRNTPGWPHAGPGLGNSVKDAPGIGSPGIGKSGPLDKGPGVGFPSGKSGSLDKGPGNSSPFDRGNPDKGPPSFTDRGPTDKGGGDGGAPGSATDKGSSSFAERGASDRGSSHSDKGSPDRGSDRGSNIADHGPPDRGERDASGPGRGGTGGSSSDKELPGENLQAARSENPLPRSRPLHVIPTCR